jgi:hypothetical protein
MQGKTLSAVVFGMLALVAGTACSGEEPKPEGGLSSMNPGGKGGTGGTGVMIGVTGGGGAGGAGQAGGAGAAGTLAGSGGAGAGTGGAGAGTGGAQAISGAGGMSGAGGCIPLEPNPTGNSETCPVAEPELFDDCSEQTLECRYYQPVDDPCTRRPFLSYSYTCCSGTWLGSDCPEPVADQNADCPEMLPFPDADCATPDVSCGYENATLLGPEVYDATCCSGRWHRCEPHLGEGINCPCP